MCDSHRKLEGTPVRVPSSGRRLSDKERARDLLHGLYSSREIVEGFTGPNGLGEWRQKALLQVCEVLGVTPPTLDELEARLGKLEMAPDERAYLLKPLRS